METTINIDQIINQIKRLDYNSKINILSELVNLLKREERVTKSISLISLKGLGKEIWQEIDTATYISTERESWD